MAAPSLRSLANRVLRVPAALLQRLRPGVRILMYHRVDDLPKYDQLAVSTARFREQMRILASTRRVVSLETAVEMLRRGQSEPVVAITFDDGYLDNLHNALPVLREFSLPATIFVTTEFCDQSRVHPRYAPCDGRLHLSWEEVRMLARDPLITIGSHTRTHPFLSRLDAQAVEREIRDSRQELESALGIPVKFFCYPSGDFSQREADLVRAAGYEAAVSVAPGLNRPPANLYELRRTEITDRDGAAEFIGKLDGAFDLLHAYLHRRRLHAQASARRQAAIVSARG